jgi:hypothetical protein
MSPLTLFGYSAIYMPNSQRAQWHSLTLPERCKLKREHCILFAPMDAPSIYQAAGRADLLIQTFTLKRWEEVYRLNNPDTLAATLNN